MTAPRLSRPAPCVFFIFFVCIFYFLFFIFCVHFVAVLIRFFLSMTIFHKMWWNLNFILRESCSVSFKLEINVTLAPAELRHALV
jgi:hypothetical protein